MKRIASSVIVLTLFMQTAAAHRMDIAYEVQSSEIVLEAWMGADEAVSNGDVTITNEAGDVLVQDKTDADGFYRWSPETADTVVVQIYGGQGHNQRITIPVEDIQTAIAHTEASEDTSATTAPESPPVHEPHAHTHNEPSASRSTQDAISTPIRVLLGLTFIFSLSATWLSYENSKRLRAIEKRLKSPDA